MAERERWRFVLIALGAIGGFLVPFVSHRVPERGVASGFSEHSVLAVVVNGAFGALAGWALGALVDHLRGTWP